MATFVKIIITCYCLLSPLTLTAVNSDCGPFALKSDLLPIQADFDVLEIAFSQPLPSSEIVALNAAVNALESQFAGVAASVAALTPPAQVAGKMPQTCSDLKSMGYLRNGFFNLLNQSNGHIQTTFCDFTKPASSYDTVIGVNDVKTTNVYFYARLTDVFKVAKAGVYQPVTLNSIETNVGGGFDGTTFTAPVNGIYQFIFHGFSKLEVSGKKIESDMKLSTFLQINGKNNSGSFAFETVNTKQLISQNTVINTNGGIHQIVALNKSDVVTLTANYDLYSTSTVALVQFTGMLLHQTLLMF